MECLHECGAFWLLVVADAEVSLQYQIISCFAFCIRLILILKSFLMLNSEGYSQACSRESMGETPLPLPVHWLGLKNTG